LVAFIAVSSAVYAIDKPYSYQVPDHLKVLPGMRVIVPFGRGNKKTEGFVLALQKQDQDGLKALVQVLDEEPLLSENDIRMAAFVRERYFCTFYDVIRAMLPAGIWFHTSVQYELTEYSGQYAALINRQPLALQVMEWIILQQGKVEEAQLKKQFPDEEALGKAVRYLIRKNLLRSNESQTRKARDKTEKIVSLAVSSEEAMKYALRKQQSAPLQYALLQLLSSAGSGNSKELCYYTGATMSTVKRLAQLGYVRLSDHEVFRTPLPQSVLQAEPLVLNEEQETAYQQLVQRANADEPGVALLYGVTGSGKTAVYIQLIRRALAQGKQAVLLVPEIALTPQLLTLLMAHFGSQVAVLHSGLRVTERYDEWKRIRKGLARVVVGTRSAVFAPVDNLGILIVDEEQEHTYKSENAPRYHAREVAIYRGSKSHALVVLGSATPSIETMYRAKSGQYLLCRLTNRYNGMDLPHAELVDMKAELKSGNSSSISEPLRLAMEETFAQDKQCILFLNRRGAGKYRICVDCGTVTMCPRCSVHLTYHAVNGRLMCHMCGYSEAAQNRCQQCGGHCKTVGSGTQKVEQELLQLFPDKTVLRMDADTITAANNHEAILNRFRTEKIPILLGTQMVAKGLNFEDVTLVGVLDADMALYSGNYRASETTFSLISQVVGRSGRGSASGRALIQTMTPEHSVLRLAAEQDYDGFYDLELSMRKLQNCPPFLDLFALSFVGPFEDLTLKAAAAFRGWLEEAFRQPGYLQLKAQILGPAPATIVKVNNSYRYHITIHCANSKPVRRLMAHLLQSFAKDHRFRGVTAFADTNAYE